MTRKKIDVSKAAKDALGKGSPKEKPRLGELLGDDRARSILGTKPAAQGSKDDDATKAAMSVRALGGMWDKCKEGEHDFSESEVFDKASEAFSYAVKMKDIEKRADVIRAVANLEARFARKFDSDNLEKDAVERFKEAASIAEREGYDKLLERIRGDMKARGLLKPPETSEPSAENAQARVATPMPVKPEDEELAKKQLDEVKDDAISKKYDKALERAEKIEIAGIRHKAYEKIADAYASEDKYSNALDIAKKIKKEDGLFYARVVMEIARDYQTQSKENKNKNILDATKTLKIALKAAENAPDTAKHTDPRYTILSKKEWIDEIKKEQTELDAKIDKSPTLKKMLKSRKRRPWYIALGTTVVLLVLGQTADIYNIIMQMTRGDEKSGQTAENKPPYVTMVGGLAQETAGEVNALENVDERILEEGGYAGLINRSIDVDKLKHRIRAVEAINKDIEDVDEALQGRKSEVAAYVTTKYLEKKAEKLENELKKAEAKRDTDEIEKDIDKVKEDIESISELEELDEESKLEKLKAKLEELEKLEAELADAELSRDLMEIETELENVKKALEEGEGGETFASFEKEALDELKKELEEEKIEAEKMHKYLNSQEVFNKLWKTNCPVSETTGEQVGNGSCDNYVYARFEGADGKTMWLRVPYNERDILVDEYGEPVLINGKVQQVCAIDCPKGKARPKEAKPSQGKGAFKPAGG